jgi:hypothetical protein
VQADWAHLGVWPLADGMADLFALVAILGCSWAPAVRLAADHTRAKHWFKYYRVPKDQIDWSKYLPEPGSMFMSAAESWKEHSRGCRSIGG